MHTDYTQHSREILLKSHAILSVLIALEKDPEELKKLEEAYKQLTAEILRRME
jgi:hypothetical protein